MSEMWQPGTSAGIKKSILAVFNDDNKDATGAEMSWGDVFRGDSVLNSGTVSITQSKLRRYC